MCNKREEIKYILQKRRVLKLNVKREREKSQILLKKLSTFSAKKKYPLEQFSCVESVTSCSIGTV